MTALADLLGDGRVLVVLAALVTALLLWPRSHRMASADVAAGDARVEDTCLWRGWARVRRLLRREVRLRRQRSAWVADFAELSAVGLDAGLPAVEASRLACEVELRAGSSGAAELSERLGVAQQSGTPVGQVLVAAARSDPDLAFLARAWQLTDEFGVAAAPAARTSAQVLRERAAGDQRRAVLSAGPRASMWLLTLLPLAGPLVTVVLGLPVQQVYGEPAALLAASVGFALTAMGWWWSRALLRRAVRPTEAG